MVECGIASLQEREDNLKKTLDSLYEQMDRIHVVLNGYDHMPDFLVDSKITVYMSSKNKGARMKFYAIDGCRGYYFTCDDDLVYPNDYARKMVDTLRRYDNRVVVTAHGGNIHQQNIKRVLKDRSRFEKEQLKDRYIMMGGTGVMAFHQSTLQFEFENFPSYNMVDADMFYQTQTRQIPVVQVKRPEKWIYYQTDVKQKFNIYKYKRQDNKKRQQFRNYIDRIKNPRIYAL